MLNPQKWYAFSFLALLWCAIVGATTKTSGSLFDELFQSVIQCLVLHFFLIFFIIDLFSLKLILKRAPVGDSVSFLCQ